MNNDDQTNFTIIHLRIMYKWCLVFITGYWWRLSGLKPTDMRSASPVGGQGALSLVYRKSDRELSNVFGECHAPCSLKKSFVYLEKEQAHCNRYIPDTRRAH
jgi:hypothetical protein